MLDRSIATEVRRKRLTYLGPDKLGSLYDCIDSVQGAHLPGDFTEFGVALGGSGICLACALDDSRRYFGFDVFSMIPPPSDKDGESVHDRYRMIKGRKSSGIGGDLYYGYIDNLHDVVKANFASFGCSVDNSRISLVKGLFSETLPLYSEMTIAIAHIDCDWYQPVVQCLDYVWPRLTRGGFIILDDYNDWDGCTKATDEFISSHKTAELIRSRPHAVIRKPTSMTED